MNINILIKTIKNSNNYDSLKIDEIYNILTYCTKEYREFGTSPLTDQEFDSLELYFHHANPTHKYFIGEGSSVRGDKIPLPIKMGGLNQAQIGELTPWISKNNLEDEKIIVSDKMDGVSCLLIYDDEGNLQIAYSSSDGIEGQDISRHVSKIPNIPSTLNHKMLVRGEIEISDSAFEIVKTLVKTRGGKEYKNPRNCVAGLLNAKENNINVYEHLTFVAFEMVGIKTSKVKQLEEMKRQGFKIVNYHEFYGDELYDDMLAEFISSRKEKLDFAIDGVVLDVDSYAKRSLMTSDGDSLNPKYAVKYKVMDADNLALANVINVEVNVSKHGYIKTRINIEPTDLMGVTIQYCTGFNMKYIYNNEIEPGCEISITRSGDVIPFITGVTKQSGIEGDFTERFHENIKAQLGDILYDWNETGVDLILFNADENDEVIIKQTIAFFTAIDTPNLKEGNIRHMFAIKCYDSAQDAIIEMLNYDKEQWVNYLGVNGGKIFDGIRTKTFNIPLYTLLGAVPFFGVGVGKRKFKKLVDELQIEDMSGFTSLTKEEMIEVDSFEEKTAAKVMEGMKEFIIFMGWLPKFVKIEFFKKASNSAMAGQSVVFSNVRDKALDAIIGDAGGDVKSSVSKNTTLVVTDDVNASTGKLNKARELGIEIIDLNELRERLGMGSVEYKPKKVKAKSAIDDMVDF